MTVSLKPDHLKRYRDLVWLGAAAGGLWLVIDILLYDRNEPPGR